MCKKCSENQTNVQQKYPKRVWKCPPGLSISQDASKLRSESNGMPPGAQNPEKHHKKSRKYYKIPKCLEKAFTPIPYMEAYYMK